MEHRLSKPRFLVHAGRCGAPNPVRGNAGLRAVLVLALAIVCPLSTAAEASIRIQAVKTGGNVEVDTIRELLDGVASLRRSAPDDDLIVDLPPGDIRIERPLEIRAVHTGAGRGSLTFRGAPDGSTRLLGSVAVPAEAIRLPSEVSAVEAWRPALRPEVRVVDLHALPIRRNFALGSVMTRAPLRGQVFQVTDGDRPMRPARWPNAQWSEEARLEKPNDAAGGLRVELPEALFSRWKGEPGLRFSGFWRYDWFYESVPVVRKEPQRHSVRIDGLRQPYGPEERPRFIVENAISELDEPGEFVLLPNRRHLLVYPFQDTPDLKVSIAQDLVDIKGARNVTFENIVFEGALDRAIIIDSSEGVTVRDGAVFNIGGDAITASDSPLTTIDRMVIADIGGHGVLLDAGNRATLSPGASALQHSLVTRVGRATPAGPSAVWLSGVGNRVVDTLIMDVPHHAILVHGNDHVIEGNEIARAVTDTDDAGAIYMGRDWTERGTRIRYNLFRDIGAGENTPATFISTIYLDDGESGFLIEENVFWNVARGVVMHGGRDTLIRRNAFLSSRGPALWLGFAATTSNTEWDRGGTMRQKMEAMPTTSPLWMTAYPSLQDVLKNDRIVPMNNRSIDNVIFADEPLHLKPLQGRPISPDLLPMDRTWTYPPAPDLFGPSVSRAALAARLRDDPRLAPLNLELADPGAALRSLRHAERAIRAD